MPDSAPTFFPQYRQPANPKGILPPDISQSKLLFKAIKTFAKIGNPKTRLRHRKQKKGLIADDTIVINRRKPHFY